MGAVDSRGTNGQKAEEMSEESDQHQDHPSAPTRASSMNGEASCAGADSSAFFSPKSASSHAISDVQHGNNTTAVSGM
jgi:hypothetical protein